MSNQGGGVTRLFHGADERGHLQPASSGESGVFLPSPPFGPGGGGERGVRVLRDAASVDQCLGLSVFILGVAGRVASNQ